jgi:rhamnosyltransferase
VSKVESNPKPSGVCGVVVLYYPDDSVAENLRAMVAECDSIVAMDNGSSAEVRGRCEAVPGVTLISLGENLGVAAALNRGAAWASDRGCEWIVAFDQDSRPQRGMVDALWAVHESNSLAAVIGPRIQEEGAVVSRYRWVRRHPMCPMLFQRVGATNQDLMEVTMLVTSGSLIELALWRRLGGFDEALFIDYIDTDYCLRAIRAGRRVAVAANAVLEHRLGDRQTDRLLGREFRPTHHAAFRHYYMARNRVRMWGRHAMAVPHWSLFDLCFAGFNGFRVLAFEKKRWWKLKAIMLGTWDGLFGRFGPCPTWRRRSFE